MNKVTHFEIPTDDIKRAQEFYKEIFGWEITMDMGETVLVNTTTTGENGMPNTPGAINGDLFKRDGALQHPLIVIDVEDIEAKLKEIEAKGGKTLVGKTEVMDMGWCAYFSDSEGNVIGIWESPKQ